MNNLKFYTEPDIKKLLCKIRDAGLSAPAKMLSAAPAELVGVCNGIGAEWMSERSRAVLTKALKYCEGAAAIHDFEYDAQTSSQPAADERFLLNALREVRYTFPQWWNWRRWLGERAALAAYEILSRTGKVAWALAYFDKHNGKDLDGEREQASESVSCGAK